MVHGQHWAVPQQPSAAGAKPCASLASVNSHPKCRVRSAPTDGQAQARAEAAHHPPWRLPRAPPQELVRQGLSHSRLPHVPQVSPHELHHDDPSQEPPP